MTTILDTTDTESPPPPKMKPSPSSSKSPRASSKQRPFGEDAAPSEGSCCRFWQRPEQKHPWHDAKGLAVTASVGKAVATFVDTEVGAGVDGGAGVGQSGLYQTAGGGVVAALGADLERRVPLGDVDEPFGEIAVA